MWGAWSSADLTLHFPVNQSSDRFTDEGFTDVVRLHHVEHDDRLVVFHTKAECGGVHDFELAGQRVVEGEALKAGGIGVFYRIRIVDAIDFGRFENHVCGDLAGAEGGGGVGGKEGVAGSGGEDDDPPPLPDGGRPPAG